MATVIHPTAIVAPGAEIGQDVTIEAYAIIGPHVKVGDGTLIQTHAGVEGHTTLGEKCELFSFACIGKKTQDLKYAGATTYVEVGARTVLREFSTIHLGTKEGEVTRVGSDCLIMAYNHLAHGCQLGNHVIMSNGSQVAGEVHVGDHAIIGGMSGVHQFVRIGQHAMIGGATILKQDAPPYMITDGADAVVRGPNIVGLQRRGFPLETRNLLKEAYRLLYREGLNRSQALERISYEIPDSPEVQALVAFYKSSQRGVI